MRNLFLRPRKVSTSKRNNDNNENTGKGTNNSIDTREIESNYCNGCFVLPFREKH